MSFPYCCWPASSWSRAKEAVAQKTPTIKIGINAAITGDIPKVGEGTKFAAQMWVEDFSQPAGTRVGDKKYPVELVVEDSEAKAESAVKANTKVITEDGVLVIIGPQASKEAIPAGGVANDYQTPMIAAGPPIRILPRIVRLYSAVVSLIRSRGRPAKFVKAEFGFSKAAVLYDVASDYPKGLAEFFRKAWGRRQRPRFSGGLRELHHQGHRFQLPVDQDKGERR